MNIRKNETEVDSDFKVNKLEDSENLMPYPESKPVIPFSELSLEATQMLAGGTTAIPTGYPFTYSSDNTSYETKE